MEIIGDLYARAKEKITGEITRPKGPSEEPLDIEVYLERISWRTKKQLILLSRVGELAKTKVLGGRFNFIVSHLPSIIKDLDPNTVYSETDSEDITWNKDLGLSVNDDAPLSYPGLLKKIKAARITVKKFLDFYFQGKNTKDLGIENITHRDLQHLPELLRADQQRVAQGWLISGERTRDDLTLIISKPLGILDKFEKAGIKVDSNRLQKLKERYHHGKFQLLVTTMDRAQQEGKERNLLAEIALDAAESAEVIGADCSFAKEYADEQIDSFFQSVFKFGESEEGYEHTALMWRESGKKLLAWNKLRPRDISSQLSEIDRRIKLSSRTKNVLPVPLQ